MTTNPRDLLDTLLGYLGFVVDIEEVQQEDGLLLQVHTHDAERLIGRRGETLDHLQYLLNRLLHEQDRRAPKVHVDVGHYRQIKKDTLIAKVRKVAENALASGQAVQLEPMNSYERRIVHQAFKDDQDVETVSPEDDARVKRITIRPRK